MPVTIVDYDSAWPVRFAEQRAAILAADNSWVVHIDHIGSTAVPGLAAKPIIDIAVAVKDVDTDGAALSDAVRSLGYEPFDAGMPGRLMLTRDEHGVRTHHLHIMPLARWDLMKERLMRDWLLTHPVDRDRYAALKRDIATTGADGLAYTRAKTAFVQEIVDAARAARGLASENVWEE
ncbi:MAG TPA: GrpB family protein [Pseudonocardiaceae bacterium]|nr:GrpB family protein [Pseudonocardiaceae bacterium]